MIHWALSSLDTKSNHQVPQLTRQPVKKLTNRFIVRIFHSHDCPTTLMLQPSSDEGHNTETLEYLLTFQERTLVNFYLIFCVSAACQLWKSDKCIWYYIWNVLKLPFFAREIKVTGPPAETLDIREQKLRLQSNYFKSRPRGLQVLFMDSLI